MDDHLDKLLAPDRLSGAEHDRILANVLPAKGLARVRWWWWWWAPLAMAASALLLFVDSEQFRAKGSTPALIVEASCGSDACASGSRAVVAVSGVSVRGRVTAHLLSPSGRRMEWLTPETDLQLATEGERVVLPRVILVDPLLAQEPGTWQLVVAIDGMSATTTLEVAR